MPVRGSPRHMASIGLSRCSTNSLGYEEKDMVDHWLPFQLSCSIFAVVVVLIIFSSVGCSRYETATGPLGKIQAGLTVCRTGGV